MKHKIFFPGAIVVLMSLGIVNFAFAAQKGKIPSSLKEFNVGPPTCSFRLTANHQSRVFHDERGFVNFAEFGDSGDFDRHFSFHCQSVIASDYCLVGWFRKYTEADPSTVKIMDIRYYKNFSQHYNTVLFSANATAVAPPRPRSIYFCFDNGVKAVDGFVSIGNERINRPDPVIRLLKSLRIQ